MADKSFGVRQINIAGSGTPKLETSGSLDINATNVAISTDMSVGGTITVGDSFIKSRAVGLGTTDTTGRNAGVSTATGTLIFNSTTQAVEVWNGSEWDTLSNLSFSATGGTVDTSSRPGWSVHTFTGSSDTFTVSGAAGPVEYLVIAGGGGGAYNGGGGGAGGMRSGTIPNLAVGTYPITVGGGGGGGINASGERPGDKGVASVFSTIASQGGGGGGEAGAVPDAAKSGGSGGGGGGETANGPGGAGNTGDGTNQPSATPVPAQGNNGGSVTGGAYGSAGGGGAGTAGTGVSSGNAGGAGGNGLANSITGSPVTRAGGGGGGAYLSNGGGAAGPGGGGAGGNSSSGGNGTANTGGGGGGGSTGSGGGGGSGGSGTIIIAWPTS
jgi:hypothetical protein